jgi:hypothetical protein
MMTHFSIKQRIMEQRKMDSAAAAAAMKLLDYYYSICTLAFQKIN